MMVAVAGTLRLGQVAMRQGGGHLRAQPLEALEALLLASGSVRVWRHPAIVAGAAAAFMHPPR
jgi:hypothetical protein